MGTQTRNEALEMEKGMNKEPLEAELTGRS